LIIHNLDSHNRYGFISDVNEKLYLFSDFLPQIDELLLTSPDNHVWYWFYLYLKMLWCFLKNWRKNIIRQIP